MVYVLTQTRVISTTSGILAVIGMRGLLVRAKPKAAVRARARMRLRYLITAYNVKSGMATYLKLLRGLRSDDFWSSALRTSYTTAP